MPEHLFLLHSLAHIEYNAMKAYVDTVVRFIHAVPKPLQSDFFG